MRETRLEVLRKTWPDARWVSPWRLYQGLWSRLARAEHEILTFGPDLWASRTSAPSVRGERT